MDFNLKVFYEQIVAYGKQLKDNRYGYMEVYEMQDGTRAYIYKAIDRETIVKIELMKP